MGLRTVLATYPRDLRARHERDREAVVPFAPYRLDGRRADAPFGGDELVEAPHALDVRVPARGVEDGPAADDVVHDDDAPRPRQVEGPLEVAGDVRLVGVDEEEVERAKALARDLRQRVERAPDAHGDDAREIGPGEVRAGAI